MLSRASNQPCFALTRCTSFREPSPLGPTVPAVQALGLIADLHCQGAYVLVKSVKLQDFNCTKPVIRYDEDFFYVEKDVEVIEDMKGVLTTEFTLKRHLMKAPLGLEVRVVK